MSRTTLALFSVLILCTRATTGTHSASAPYQRTIVDHTASASQLDTVPLDEAPALIDAIYRIRPDRRFVNAAADIVEISSGRKIDSVDIEFNGKAWDVRVDDAAAISLPELVTFHDALALLSKWASEQGGKRVTLSKTALEDVDRDLSRFYPRYLFSALRKLDAGKPLDAAASARAARAAALLVVHTTYDYFNLADPLKGRALALLAIAKSLDPACCTDSEAILADSLGYIAESQQLARSLPPGFARAYLTGDDPPPPRGAGEDWVLLLRRLRKEPLMPMRDEQKAFSATIDTEAAPLLLQNAFSSNWPVGSAVQTLLLQSADAPGTFTLDAEGEWEAKLPAPDPEKMLRQFEEKERQIAKTRTTRLVARREILSFYDANWYMALNQEFSVLFRHLCTEEGSAEFVTSLRPRTAVGQNVVAWMSNLVDAHWGKFDPKRVPAAMNSVALLGGTRRNDLLDEISAAIGGIAPENHAAARNMFRTLDSRTGETLIAGKLANFPIGHLARRDLYMKSALDRAPGYFEGERTEYYFAIGDHDALRRLGDDRTASIDDRVTALYRLTQISDDDYHTDFENVFVENGYSTERINNYWEYLNKRKQPELKERFARKILENRRDLGAISEAYVVACMANGLEAEGRYEEAWKWVEPRIPVYSGNILATATSLLQRLGRNGEAIELGKKMVGRYPDAATRANYAAVLWRMRRYADAAELFNPAKSSNVISAAEQELPDWFANTFTDAEIPEALAAYEALIEAHAPPDLLQRMSGTAYEQKRWAFAFAIMERYLKVPTSGADRNIQQREYAVAYRVLKELKGPEAAMQWFAAQFPSAASQDLLVNLLINGEFEVLTNFVVARPPRQKEVESASIIAAAFSLQRIPLTDPRWNIVRAMIPANVAPAAGTILLSLRHMMGEVDAAQVAASAVTPDNRSEAGYFLGIRAIADGSYDRALDDFLIAGEGPPQYATTSCAVSRLYAWRAKLRSWKAIASEHLL